MSLLDRLNDLLGRRPVTDAERAGVALLHLTDNLNVPLDPDVRLALRSLGQRLAPR